MNTKLPRHHHRAATRLFSADLLRCWTLGAGGLALNAALLCAQVPDAPAPAAPAAPAAQPAGGGAAGGAPKNGSPVGNDVPMFDPGTENVTFQGKNWNVNNNRLFQARFEKYLNAPEATGPEDAAYQKAIATILACLAPGNATTQNIDLAFRWLPVGSRYDIDARLCDALADAVFSAWKSQQNQERMVAATSALEQERKDIYWRAEHAGKSDNTKTLPSPGGGGGGGGKKGGGKPAPANQQDFEATMTQARHSKDVLDVEAQIKATHLKKELSQIQAKVEFQALILQFFMQRRFQHVLMGTRFYRAIFSDGDTKLNVGKDTKDLFEKSAGMPPTVGTLDSLANEAIRDVREGVKAFEFLVSKQELESASKRLGEAVLIGEYVPEIRTLPREKKRQVLEFVQKTNQLISAIDVKDYALAEKVVKLLETMAHDFDSSKPMAAIETSKQVASMHLAKARNAALKGDEVTLQTELTEATKLWPRNPELAEMAKKISGIGNLQAQAALDFDQLLGQKNHRQIFEKRVTFISMLALDNVRSKQLEGVLKNMQTIETALGTASAMAVQANFAGAWESVEKIAGEFPDDTKLSQTRADLTIKASDFVRTLQGAQDLEKKDQVGASLAWYLKAQKLYPQSDFAKDGVERLVKKILPQG